MKYGNTYSTTNIFFIIMYFVFFAFKIEFLFLLQFIIIINCDFVYNIILFLNHNFVYKHPLVGII